MADNAAQLPAQPAPALAPAPAPAPAVPAQGAAAAAQNVPAPARRNRLPRRDNLAPSNATISGIPAMYSMVSNSGFSTVQRRNISSFVPSFIVMAAVIHQMNFQMAYTHRFLQGAPAWIPPVSFMYFGVLFIIQTLRAQREVGVINDQELWLLEGFEKIYDLRSLLIPGPLVPYFQALASCSGPFEWTGDVTPRFPTDWTLNAADHYVFNHGYQRILPGLIFYMDILNKVSTTAQDYDAASMATFFTDILGQNAAAAAGSRFHLYSPGAWANVTFTLSQINSARTALAYFGLPARLDPTTSGDISHIAAYLRIYTPTGEFTNWFGNFAGIMQRFAQFYNETVPLSAIAPAGLGASIPIWSFKPNNTALVTPFTFVAAASGPPAVPAHYRVHHLLSNKASGSHVDQDLEEVAEQCSAIAMVNVSFTASGVNHGIQDNVIRHGPVWQLTTCRESGEIDFIPALNQTLTAHYHLDTRRVGN